MYYTKGAQSYKQSNTERPGGKYLPAHYHQYEWMLRANCEIIKMSLIVYICFALRLPCNIRTANGANIAIIDKFIASHFCFDSEICHLIWVLERAYIDFAVQLALFMCSLGRCGRFLLNTKEHIQQASGNR